LACTAAASLPPRSSIMTLNRVERQLCGEAILFAQQTQQLMLGSDVLVVQPRCFFRRIGQNPLALVREREVHSGRDLCSDGSLRFDLPAEELGRGVHMQEAVNHRPFLAQDAQQQVLGLDVRRAELAGLIAREEDRTTRPFRVAFKDACSPSSVWTGEVRPGSSDYLSSIMAENCAAAELISKRSFNSTDRRLERRRAGLRREQPGFRRKARHPASSSPRRSSPPCGFP